MDERDLEFIAPLERRALGGGDRPEVYRQIDNK